MEAAARSAALDSGVSAALEREGLVDARGVLAGGAGQAIARVRLGVLQDTGLHAAPRRVGCGLHSGVGAQVVGGAVPSMRVALTRLLKQQRILKTERGRYAISEAGNPFFWQVACWFRREHYIGPWEGCWMLVHDAVCSRASRSAYSAHVKALELQGFRTMAADFWVRPDNLEGGLLDMKAALMHLGLLDRVILVANAELDVDAMQSTYRAALALVRKSQARLSTLPLNDAARESILVGRTVIRTIVRDPLLPEEMMTSDRRAELVAAMRTYQSSARLVWRRVFDSNRV